MKSRTLFFCIIAAAAMFVGCTGGAGSTPDTIAFEHISIDKSYVLRGSAADFDADSDLIMQCRANLILPRGIYGHEIDSLRNAILCVAFDSVKPDLDATIISAFTRAASEPGYLPVDTTVAAEYYDGAFMAESDIASLTAKTASFAITVSSYAPRAAHGDYFTRYVNYDMAENRLIALSDLITEDGLKALPKMLRRNAYQMRAFIGGTDLKALPSDNNFYINTAGDIVFAYQPYEIASYAQGEIQIPIAPDQISDLLTPYATALLLSPR